jgi:hypothetical protein
MVAASGSSGAKRHQSMVIVSRLRDCRETENSPMHVISKAKSFNP